MQSAFSGKCDPYITEMSAPMIYCLRNQAKAQTSLRASWTASLHPFEPRSSTLAIQGGITSPQNAKGAILALAAWLRTMFGQVHSCPCPALHYCLNTP